MEAAIKLLLSTIRLLVGILLIGSVFLICANAAGRYLFLAPIIWAEEVLGYVLVWTVYLGGILVTWDGGHLKMDLLSRTLSGPARTLVNGLATISFIAIGGLIVYQSRAAIAVFTHVSQVAEIPMAWMHAALPIAFTLIVLGILIRLRGYLNGTLQPASTQNAEAIGSDETGRAE